MRAWILAALVLAGGCLAPPAPDAAPDAASGPAAFGRGALVLVDRAALAVEGAVEAASADAGPQLARCATAPGLVGQLIESVTPGRPFALVATGDNAPLQDLDVVFYTRAPTCLAASEPSAQHVSAHGDEAGYVPEAARVAIVWLYEGAHATFRYSEFPPNDPPNTVLVMEDSMRFRSVRPLAAVSTYHDLYEPHIVVAGTGTIYVAGHTASSDTHRSPVYASRDDGASWEILPDPEPLPRETRAAPGIGGRVGQGNEGGIAADGTGRAWLYDAAYAAGSWPLYGWCEDGTRACSFDPAAFDATELASTSCPEWPAPRLLDKPWAQFGDGKLLLANAALPAAVVDEFRSASMLGLYDPDAGERTWNTCVGVGGVPGVPAIRDADGHIAVPQVQRSASGEGWMVVHHGATLDAMASVPAVRAHRSWQECGLFNGYGDFSGAGSYYLFTGTSARELAVSATSDLAEFETLTFDAGGIVNYMWLAGDPRGEGALLTWGVATSCDDFAPVSFYAAHVALRAEGLTISDVSLVAANLGGTCGHYMGSDVGPDGRAYLVAHTTPAGCGGPLPATVPFTSVPWRVFIQNGGPTALT